METKILFDVSLNNPLNKHSSSGDWGRHEAHVTSIQS